MDNNSIFINAADITTIEPNLLEYKSVLTREMALKWTKGYKKGKPDHSRRHHGNRRKCI